MLYYTIKSLFCRLFLGEPDWSFPGPTFVHTLMLLPMLFHLPGKMLHRCKHSSKSTSYIKPSVTSQHVMRVFPLCHISYQTTLPLCVYIYLLYYSVIFSLETPFSFTFAFPQNTYCLVHSKLSNAFMNT